MKTTEGSFIDVDGVETMVVTLENVLPANAKPWYRTKHLIILNTFVLTLLLSSCGVGYDGSMMNGLQTLAQWRGYFGTPSSSMTGLINAVYPLGKVFSIIPAIMLSDRYGRKAPIWFGIGMIIIGTIIQATSHALPQFIVSRLIVGGGTAFVNLGSPILITEIAYPTQRGKATGLFNTCYYIGAIYAAWTTFGTFKLAGTWSWRIPSILQGSIPVLQIFGLFFVPESPRWLIANDRSSEARAFFTKYHAGGDESSPLVDFEMMEVTEAIRLEKEIKATTSYKDLFRGKPNQRRTALAIAIGIIAQWNGSGVLSYYLARVLNTVGITSTYDQTVINGCLQVFNWIVSVFGGALMVDRLGRRTLFLISGVGMLISYIVWTICSSVVAHTGSKAAGYVVVVMMFAFSFFNGIAWSPLLYAYTVEIFPYTLRGKGLAAEYLTSSLSVFISQYCNPIALANLGWKYYIFYCCLLAVFLAIVFFFFPETKGRTLEEIAEIFDGQKLITSTKGMDDQDEISPPADIQEKQS